MGHHRLVISGHFRHVFLFDVIHLNMLTRTLSIRRFLSKTRRPRPGFGVRVQSLRLYSSKIGIDWGTATSIVTVLDEDEPRVVENIEGERTTPSYVANTPEGFLVGITARRQVNF